MALFDNMPYTNLHEINLDWIIQQVKQLAADWDTFSEDMTGKYNDLHDYVYNYFDNLDLTAEVQAIIDQMEADGTLDAIINTAIDSKNLPAVITNWLQTNVTPVGSAVVVDSSLTVAGAAADAKAAGDSIAQKADSGILYKQDAFTNVGYITSTGGANSSNTNYRYISTRLLPENHNGYLYYNLFDAPDSALLIEFLNSSLQFISGTGLLGSNTRPFKMLKGRVAIPEAAKFWRATITVAQSGQYVIVGQNLSGILEDLDEQHKFIPAAIRKQNNYGTGNAGFYGDSIVRGYNPDGVIVNSPWPNQIKNMLGFSDAADYAVGGAGFAITGNSVLSQLQSDNRFSNRTHIFVGAGTNDYWYYKTRADFEAAVDDVISYIQVNAAAGASVIFITPINRSTHPNVAVMHLNEYRQIIAEKALAAGFSVIDGRQLPFESDSLGSDYTAAAQTDGLHPTQYGYDLYAAKLYDMLAGLDS